MSRALARGLAVFVAVLTLGYTIVLVAGPASAEDALPPGWTATKWGPLSPADRDLVIKVRLAGLWEMPAGDQAQRRGVDPRVRQIGAKIATEHAELDRATLQVAAKLGLEVPDEPIHQQRLWLGEMDDAKGKDFDQIFIDRLRVAHGQVFPIIGYVRAGTRNELIREFAATGNDYVGRHMDYLESSGLVDWDLVPVPPDPVHPFDVESFAGLTTRGRGLDPLVIWIVLAAALVAGAVTTARVIRAR
jgi:predicted outer membrane protein